jgi:hypothetical protein
LSKSSQFYFQESKHSLELRAMSGHVNHMSAPPAKLVIVGSKNPVKITAVKDAFEAVWPDGSFSFEGMDVPSGVGEHIARHSRSLLHDSAIATVASRHAQTLCMQATVPARAVCWCGCGGSDCICSIRTACEAVFSHLATSLHRCWWECVNSMHLRARFASRAVWAMPPTTAIPCRHFTV